VGQGVDDPIQCATALKYAGIRNIRDDGSLRHVQDWIAMHRQAGIRVVLTRSGPDEKAIDEMIAMSKELAAAGALLAMEGPNEPNNWPVTFHGTKPDAKTSFLQLAHWQQAFYAKIKGDPALKNYPVFHSSEAGGSEPDNVGMQFLTIPPGAGTLMPDGTRYADFANVHNYICRQPKIVENMAWLNADPNFRGWADGIYGEYGRTWHKHFAGYTNEQLTTLPRVTTETGWAAGPKGLSEEQQARLYLNLYLAQFEWNYKHTFIYLLRDAGGGDAHYGMFTSDYRPKKSAEYLHNLTAILAEGLPVDGLSRAKADVPGYSIPDQPTNVHDLLLQKRQGSYAIVVWGERVGGSCNATVQLAKPAAHAKVYDPTSGVAPRQSLEQIKSIPLTMGDHPLIIEIAQ
jgi:hypothetical protein